MKKTKFFIAFLLFFIGSFYSCEKKEENSLKNIFYIVGFDGNAEVDVKKGTAKSGGYLFISENLQDSLLANNRFEVEEGEYWNTGYRMGNLLDDIIAIPIEAFMSSRNCGFQYFSEEYRFSFKVQINSYRPMTEEEIVDVPRLINTMCMPTFHIPYYSDFFPFKLIVITSISKIN